MPPPVRRPLALLACLLAVSFVLADCSGTGPAGSGATSLGPTTFSPTATPSLNLPKCQEPKRIPTATWFPDGLPLPDGSYQSQELGDTLGYHRAIFVVPGTLQELARLVLSEWPKQGWTLGRGDSEPGEVEEQFTRPPEVGAFRAQSVYCSPGYNLMLLIYAAVAPTLPPPGPTNTPSPLAT